MARIQSAREGRQATDPDPIRNPTISLFSRGRRLHAGLCLAGIAMAWSTCVLAQSGPGLGFKVGVQTLESPLDLDKTTRARYELELSSARFFDDHFDLAFTVGGSSLGSFDTYYSDEVDGVFIDEIYDDDLSLIDIRLAARFYPLGDASTIRPYVGGGIGYFWFLDQWDYEYAETVEDPFFPGVYDTFIEKSDGVDTAAKGFFPFLTAGVTIPIGDQGELLFDFQYDFEKEDNGYDFGGPIYMIGARFRF
jgi:outer membrane protein W